MRPDARQNLPRRTLAQKEKSLTDLTQQKAAHRITAVTAIVPRRLSARESDEQLIALAKEIAAGKYDDMLDQMGREAEANLPAGYRFDWEKGEVVCTDPALADQPVPISRP